MAYKQRWLEHFDVLDVDNSGAIDLNDTKFFKQRFAKLLNRPEDAPQVLAAAKDWTEFYQALIKAFDVNNDQKVTKDEFLAGVEKYFVGKTAETVPAWWREHLKKVFLCDDKNGDGVLSLEEKLASSKRFNPNVSEADVKHAYEWATKKSSSGIVYVFCLKFRFLTQISADMGQQKKVHFCKTAKEFYVMIKKIEECNFKHVIAGIREWNSLV
eukprot:Phypoly_transcript_19176.p1 GENE.Phypoly_transcript_19176~~Phypoly_transcript_19176.p1  ORF type:complete len:213 (+),score=30.24 Phypoly_transcript_19176:83-721(+)